MEGFNDVLKSMGLGGMEGMLGMFNPEKLIAEFIQEEQLKTGATHIAWLITLHPHPAAAGEYVLILQYFNREAEMKFTPLLYKAGDERGQEGTPMSKIITDWSPIWATVEPKFKADMIGMRDYEQADNIICAVYMENNKPYIDYFKIKDNKMMHCLDPNGNAMKIELTQFLEAIKNPGAGNQAPQQ